MCRRSTAVLLTLVAACGPAAPGSSPDASLADAPPPTIDALHWPDAGSDAAPADAGPPAGLCEPCTSYDQCGPDALCLMTGSGRLCLPRCDPGVVECPHGFSCAGVDSYYCVPQDGLCCLDDDDDGWGQGANCFGVDCDDADPVRNPGQPELCNGSDDDCDASTADGSSDPGAGLLCDGTDTDLCPEGLTLCFDAAIVCEEDSPDDLDLCNGVDDDCDPATADGAGEPTLDDFCDGADPDHCTEGKVVCVAGSLLCNDATGDAVELCNGLDDDCDAATADGAADSNVGTACDGPDSDLCAEGTTACVGGAVVCSDLSADNVELCNGVDDDCIPASPDGAADPEIGAPCDGDDGDRCAEGVTTCAAGALTCSDATATTLDYCNGADEDCDPATADGAADPGTGVACDGPDTDLCLEGTTACAGGVITCSDSTGSLADVCNGLDDDCNPATADGSADTATGPPCDGPDGDLCPEGTASCVGGAVVCSDATGTTLDLCNGLDEDCDPATADGADDAAAGQPCDGPDLDLCAEGETACIGGASVCGDLTGNALELCNGADDDCNPATLDGAGDPAVGLICDGADVDLCTEGITACLAGEVACNDLTGSTAELCNGVDDDCNPATADGSADPGNGTPCDGPDGDRCAEGTLACAGGALVCDDATGTTHDVCNGVDDDCDAGSLDGSEDPGLGVPCDGADTDLCAEGARVCSGGALVCNDGSGDAIELCNDLDDDCDGATDEDFDFLSDIRHCGGCNQPCGALCCDGTCTPASASDCGACGHACTAGMLVVNELMINPLAVGDDVGEWVEIYNPRTWDIDLRGFILEDDAVQSHTIAYGSPVLVPAGGLIVLGISANFAANGGVDVEYQYSSFMMANSLADEVVVTAFGVEIDRVNYTPGFVTSGASKELGTAHQTAAGNDTLTNWCTAVAPLGMGDYGTPGEGNDCSL